MRLLIIGSLSGQIGAASQIAVRRGAKVSQADDISSALSQLRGGRGADLIMADVGLNIQDLVSCLESEHIAIPVIACGVSTNATAAVAAIKAGAKEYIPLPPDPEMIAAVLAAVVQQDHTLVFRDPAMQDVMKLTNQVAPSEASILITGESGTGKELIAHHIHKKSHRANKIFVAINCAAIPETLLESELFGHEKGAFTGAIARRIGKFEEAEGGTLLLDEISEIDVRLQAKLLRVVQERVLTRVGNNTPIRINVRILATSNRNLQEEVKKGTFREDLFFRLNVITLALPPLRERPADIDVLSHHFCEKYASLNKIPVRPISAPALEKLKRHTWQGNVRELENTIHRATLLEHGPEITEKSITLTDGNTEYPDLAEKVGTLVGKTVADVERDLIIDTLRHTLGNRTHAANILGISIRTLRNKLRLYSDQGMSVPPPSGEADVPA